MTDTTILDGLMATLARNPLTPERLGHLGPGQVGEGAPYGIALQSRPTDDRPFYAREEVAHDNARFAEVVDLFHQDVKQVRYERPRSGPCGRTRTVERHIDGQVWTRYERCGGTVHAVETKVNGAVRVDGKCLTCGWEGHRAGLLHEKG